MNVCVARNPGRETIPLIAHLSAEVLNLSGSVLFLSFFSFVPDAAEPLCLHFQGRPIGQGLKTLGAVGVRIGRSVRVVPLGRVEALE